MPRPILITYNAALWFLFGFFGAAEVTFTALHHGARWMRREAEARAESTHAQIFGGPHA